MCEVKILESAARLKIPSRVFSFSSARGGPVLWHEILCSSQGDSLSSKGGLRQICVLCRQIFVFNVTNISYLAGDLKEELFQWRRRNRLSRKKAVAVLKYFGLSTTVDSLYDWENEVIPHKSTLKKLERILDDHPIVDYKLLFKKIAEKSGERATNYGQPHQNGDLNNFNGVSGSIPYGQTAYRPPMRPNRQEKDAGSNSRMTFGEDMMYRYRWHDLPT